MTDRELDAKVAEEVMGIKRIEHKSGGYDWVYWKRIEASDAPVGWYDQHYPIPFYSTDIAAAWEVWEHMKADPDRWQRFESALPSRTDGVHVMVTPDLWELNPKVICLAALEAVKVKP